MVQAGRHRKRPAGPLMAYQHARYYCIETPESSLLYHSGWESGNGLPARPWTQGGGPVALTRI